MTDAGAPTDRSGAFSAETVSEYYEERLVPVIFEPWAERLVEVAQVAPGDRVLDVASGTGAVARAAARRAGPGGVVVASDISAPMLARFAERPPTPGAAAIDFVVSPAEAVPLPDAEFDVALCQQGLQFFPDRPAAAAELRRLLRPGGRLAVSVWALGHRLEPFDEYAEALAAAGVQPPFAGAFEPGSFAIAPGALTALLSDAGLAGVEESIIAMDISWPNAAAAAAAMMGTPFGPLLSAMPSEQRVAVEADVLRRFEGLGATHPMYALVATARRA